MSERPWKSRERHVRAGDRDRKRKLCSHQAGLPGAPRISEARKGSPLETWGEHSPADTWASSLLDRENRFLLL